MGELMFIRARYGHGGRVGYDKEWRADPKRAGGGELMDQGVHLIDLAGWFLGALQIVNGHVATYVWDMPVDDNAFLDLQTAKGQTAWLHASCTEWKNLFSFEIYGRHAKLHIEGLGGSYGVEKLYHYQMKPEMGIPDTKVYEFPGPDESWKNEMSEFEKDIKKAESGKRKAETKTSGLAEARAALKIVEGIYKKVASENRIGRADNKICGASRENRWRFFQNHRWASYWTTIIENRHFHRRKLS